MKECHIIFIGAVGITSGYLIHTNTKQIAQHYTYSAIDKIMDCNRVEESRNLLKLGIDYCYKCKVYRSQISNFICSCSHCGETTYGSVTEYSKTDWTINKSVHLKLKWIEKQT